jgi:uridylate kinase
MSDHVKRFVVSLGGSLIVPDEIDTSFLKKFKESILKLVEEGYSFIIIPGGGATARRYQVALKTFGVTDRNFLDEVGISTVRPNAYFLKVLFKDKAYSEVVLDENNLPESPIVIAANGKLGRSSDAGAVELAVSTGLIHVINLSNIARVYSEDPKLNPEAKAFNDLTWKDYRAMIPSEWDPGMSTPFDPVASKMAEEADLTVAIMDGHDTEAFEEFVRAGQLKGTLIHP